MLETYVAFAPKGFLQFTKAMPAWLKDKLFQKKQLLKYLQIHDNSTPRVGHNFLHKLRLEKLEPAECLCRYKKLSKT